MRCFCVFVGVIQSQKTSFTGRTLLRQCTSINYSFLLQYAFNLFANPAILYMILPNMVIAGVFWIFHVLIQAVRLLKWARATQWQNPCLLLVVGGWQQLMSWNCHRINAPLCVDRRRRAARLGRSNVMPYAAADAFAWFAFVIPLWHEYCNVLSLFELCTSWRLGAQCCSLLRKRLPLFTLSPLSF